MKGDSSVVWNYQTMIFVHVGLNYCFLKQTDILTEEGRHISTKYAV